jgi:hypothetical protein
LQTVIRVPADEPTPAAALRAAAPGDTILLAPGSYPGGLTVPRSLHDLTIRGEDRNGVVFDGRDRGSNGITIAADGVTVENLTVHSFPGNGVLWHGVSGYTAMYVTVWNVGGYGIYAVGSDDGRIFRSFVSGAGDAAFYVGECHPCDAELDRDTAVRSGIGFSATNAGGNLLVHRSVFDRNGTGILPNSYDDEARPPQREAMFRDNMVVGSGTVPTPATDPVDGLIGIGIGIAGGMDDVVGDNVVAGSSRYGIAVFATVETDRRTWRPSGNRVTGNTVRASGIADLALAEGAAAGNCFEDNAAATTAPTDLERTHGCGRTTAPGGDAAVSAQLEITTPEAYSRSGDHPPYAEMPAPGPQPQEPSFDRTDRASPAEPDVGAFGAPIAFLGRRRYSL